MKRDTDNLKVSKSENLSTKIFSAGRELRRDRFNFSREAGTCIRKRREGAWRSSAVPSLHLRSTFAPPSLRLRSPGRVLGEGAVGVPMGCFERRDEALFYVKKMDRGKKKNVAWFFLSNFAKQNEL